MRGPPVLFRTACYTVEVVITVLLTIVHVLVCLFLIVVILLQSGKAADLAGAFGGMGSQTAFGPRGSATLLSKATTISTVVFMLTSISLSILATRGAGVTGTALERHGTKNAPAVPASHGPAVPTGQAAPIQVPVAAPSAPVGQAPAVQVPPPGQAPAPAKK